MKILHADHFCQEKKFLLIDAKNKLQGIGTLPVIHDDFFSMLMSIHTTIYFLFLPASMIPAILSGDQIPT